MAAKKKKGKKEEKKVVEEVNEFSGMPLQQLRVTFDSLKQNLNDVSKQKNKMMIERENTEQLLDSAAAETSDLEVVYLLKCNEQEQVEFEHEQYLNSLQQKLTFLTYEHKLNLKNIQDELFERQKKHQEDIITQDEVLIAKTEDYENRILNLEQQNEEDYLQTKLILAKNLDKVKATFNENLGKLQTGYKAKIDEYKVSLALRKKVQLHETSERKNLHIYQLKTNHEDRYKDIKSYYQDITSDNLELISTLKRDIAELEEKNKHMVKYISELRDENKKISIPANESQQQLIELNNKLKNKQKDELRLNNNISRLNILERNVLEMTKSMAVAKNELQQVEQGYRTLHDTFKEAKENLAETILKTKQKLEKEVMGLLN